MAPYDDEDDRYDDEYDDEPRRPRRPRKRRAPSRRKVAPPGTGIFVMGLLGLLMCQILGVIAWIQGNEYMSQCRRMGVQPDGMAVAGRTLGIISVVILLLQVGLFVVFFGFLALGAAAG